MRINIHRIRINNTDLVVDGFFNTLMPIRSPDCAVLPVCNRGEISSAGNAKESQCAPAPMGGRVGARGEIVT
jgi:hypothetical protein